MVKVSSWISLGLGWRWLKMEIVLFKVCFTQKKKETQKLSLVRMYLTTSKSVSLEVKRCSSNEVNERCTFQNTT